MNDFWGRKCGFHFTRLEKENFITCNQTTIRKLYRCCKLDDHLTKLVNYHIVKHDSYIEL
ncbi:hypothetical protein Syun_000317 [Stephania yunnanensis]|uniref:Uncharacterized protein n=1 Tax=Stephania yunnanensis TaxID=152371 RepID=A0AAP0LBQ5_9MAGN